MSKGFLHKASLPEKIIFAGERGKPAAFSVIDLSAQCIIQVLLSQRAYILMRAVLHILYPPSFSWLQAEAAELWYPQKQVRGSSEAPEQVCKKQRQRLLRPMAPLS